jgi:hypothetical protein
MKRKTSKLSGYVRAVLFAGCISLLMNCSADKPIIVEPPCEDQILGIYSETASNRLVPGIDTFIGIDKHLNATFSESDFIDDSQDHKEGGISKKATMSVDGSKGQWAVWFIQWGQEGSPESETIDMSAYADGTLSFWVKSSINLEIGIRSGNIDPNEARSKVYLNNYSSFKDDNVWHRLSIPIPDFLGSNAQKPLADLKQIKILFAVASNTPSGGTGGVPKTFWIDDVRWEKVCKP